jgi:hypothetical protein
MVIRQTHVTLQGVSLLRNILIFGWDALVQLRHHVKISMMYILEMALAQ